jgi:hypothetical protein
MAGLVTSRRGRVMMPPPALTGSSIYLPIPIWT